MVTKRKSDDSLELSPPKRRSRSCQLKKKSLKEASSSDDEEVDVKDKKAKQKWKQMVKEDEDDSASDFEDVMPKNDAEESDDDDFEEVPEIESEPPAPEPLDPPPAQKKKRASTTKPRTLETKLKPSQSESFFSSRPIRPPQKALTLSESDDSDSEVSSPSVSTSSSQRTAYGFKASLKPSPRKTRAEVADQSHVATQLENLARGIQDLSQAWTKVDGDVEEKKDVPKIEVQPPSTKKSSGKKSKRDSSTKKKDKPKSEPLSDLNNISQLLAIGEGVKSEELSDDSDGGEEVRNEPSTSKNIEITLDAPKSMRRKKKAFDMEAYIKRTINKAQREIQVCMHKTHILCLIGHLRYLNFQASNPILAASAMSVIPPKHSVGARQLSGLKLNHFLQWYVEAFPRPRNGEETSVMPHPFEEKMLLCMENFVVGTKVEKVLVFLLLARAQGWECRLILNLNPVSQKLSAGNGEKQKEVKSAKTEPSTEKGRSKTSKRNASSSSDEEMEEVKPAKRTAVKASKEILPKKNGETSSKRIRKSSEKKQHEESKAKSRNGRVETPSRKKEVEKKDGSSVKSRRSTDKKHESSNSTSRKKKPHKSDEDTHSKYFESPKVKSKSRAQSSAKVAKEVERRKSRSSAKKLDEESLVKKICGDEKADKDFSPDTFVASGSKSQSSKRKSDVKESKPVNDYWVEVFVQKDWMTVDPLTGKFDCAGEMESRASKPMLYVIGCNADGTVKDVTKRYAAQFNTHTRKARIDESWMCEALSPFATRDAKRDKKEDESFEKKLSSGPMPTTVSGFKDHPLYALPRHLLKFEAIYPADAPTLGFFKSEPVYARECVKTLHSRNTWLKEGRLVKIGQEPYKVVKARPKWDRMSQSVIKDQPLDVFGYWQTEEYVPPPAVDGKVPRNEYGNVELFKPWMLPKGTVHIPINGLYRVARKLGIDCAPALIGWDTHTGGSHPVFDGYIVCQEFEDTLMDAWNVEEDAKVRREEEKREKRVLDNWKKLIKGMLIKRKLEIKYKKHKA